MTTPLAIAAGATFLEREGRMFGRRRRQREARSMHDIFLNSARENPEIWRILEADGPEAYLATRKAELAEEFAVKPEVEQRSMLERAFAEMFAAVNEERGDDVLRDLSVLWVMVRGRRLTRERRVAVAFEEASREEGSSESARVSDFASELGTQLDKMAAALEEDEASGVLLPDDTVYRVFTLNENLTSLAERHLKQQRDDGRSAPPRGLERHAGDRLAASTFRETAPKPGPRAD